MSALPANLTAFGRVLRRAGLTLGTGQIVAAGQVLLAADITDRSDVRAGLRAALVMRRPDIILFDQAFDAFWRGSDGGELALAALLPQTILPPSVPTPGARRLSEALNSARRSDDSGEIAFDATGSTSDLEVLRSKDFAQMSVDELARARRALERMEWRIRPRRVRRNDPSTTGQIDARRTLARLRRTMGETMTLARRRRRLAEPPLVVLADISGSMSEYSRTILHFLHSLMRTSQRRISVFVFGTRLTNITRALRHRDVDAALASVSGLAPDWDGGTRIGQALDRFNRVWARRVLGQGAHVLLITDGLERDDIDGLSRAAQRLKASARGVTWANPLLRFAGFEAKAQGIRALTPHVSRMVPIHSLESVAGLAEALRA
jgi:uncharacterized protein